MIWPANVNDLPEKSPRYDEKNDSKQISKNNKYTGEFRNGMFSGNGTLGLLMALYIKENLNLVVTMV